VTNQNGHLPSRFSEPWIVSQSETASGRILIVSDVAARPDDFAARYGVSVTPRPINLERIFTALLRPLHSSRGERDTAEVSVSSS
jgi:hypothetical protein